MTILTFHGLPVISYGNFGKLQEKLLKLTKEDKHTLIFNIIRDDRFFIGDAELMRDTKETIVYIDWKEDASIKNEFIQIINDYFKYEDVNVNIIFRDFSNNYFRKERQ